MRLDWHRLLLAVLLCGAVGLADGVRIVHHPRQTSPDFHGHPRLVAEDPEARHGTAQAAIPGKSHPGGPICSFYSYARPAGRYRITWRVKVDDNTIAEPVFQARTGRGSIKLKGTDFKEPNVYQDFSYTAEKGEGGFFGVSAAWPGKGRIHVDWVTVVSEKLYTERELLAKKGGVDLPDAWIIPPPSPPQVHIAKGLWWDFFGVSEALGEMGGVNVACSYHFKGQGGTGLRGFPRSWQGLMQHNLVILANVDAPALRARGRLLLEEYVTNGGALLVLGGPFSFERGGYRYTALDRLLPCRMMDKKWAKADGDFVMEPTEHARGLLPADLSWLMKPHLYYYHPLEAKPEARVLVTAGGKPVVAVWDIGKGRVGVIAATAEGDPPADQLAFWEWGDMARLVAAMCRWLVSAPREERPHVMDEEARQKLEKLALPAPGDKEEQRRRELKLLLAKCGDKSFAREILSTVSNAESNPDRRFVAAVVRTVVPFVDDDFREEAETLIESGNTGKAELGLRVLGVCGAGEDGETLAGFLEKGTGAFAKGDVDDLLDAGGGLSIDSGLEIGANERLKLAAAIALGDLGDRQYVRALRKATREFAKKRQGLMTVDAVPDLNENIYQQSLAARCRLGDPSAAGPFLDAILKNTDEIEQFLNAFDNMLPNKDDKKLMSMLEIGRIRLPLLYRRQARCTELLRSVPYSVAGTFAKELASRNHPALTYFAFAALTPGPERKLTREVAASLLPLLQECQISELRLLALRLAAKVRDPELDRHLATSLATLAADADPNSARFALRTLASLKQEDRPPVVTAALKHPNQNIRRLAGLSSPLLSAEQRKALSGR